MTNCKPTKEQLAFLDWEFGAFFHFGLRAFYKGYRDWDTRDMDPSVFNPEKLDCASWLRTCKAAGMTYAIMTCKHHDGFANWPSRFSDYSVAQSPWKDGKGDVVREFTDACRRRGLCETRTHVVFGDGPQDAEVMFIGEGPGEQEDKQGIPFVGPAGHLLDDMLQMIDLDRSKVYIANIVKCRPPGNRDPLGIEQDACWQWLERQIALVQPRIIVCLGRIAAMKIIKEDFRITREHGQWFDIDQRRVMATFHPSALLRDQSKRPDAFMDLRALRKEIKAVCDGVY